MDRVDNPAAETAQSGAVQAARPPLTALGLTGYLFIGTAAVLVPSAMPFITEEYRAVGLTLAAIGTIFPARAVGGILGNLLAGVVSDRFGYSRIVLLAALALAVTLALAASARMWFLFLASFALISVAQASLTTGINAMIADANPAGRARALNLLHGIYAVGATISPLVFGLVLARGAPWRWTLAATGLIWLLYGGGAFLFCRAVRPSPPPASGDSSIDKFGTAVRGNERAQGPASEEKMTASSRSVTSFLSSNWRMLRNVGFLSLFLIAFIYNGVAYSLLGWVALFMQESAGFSIFGSISIVSVFYAALTAGRFICAAFAERIGYAATLLILAAALIFTYPLVILSADPIPLVIGVFFTGLSLSGLFPTALAYGSRLYPAQSGLVTGMLNVAMTAGAMLPPLWTGVFADLWSFQRALGVNYSMAWLLLAVCLYLGRAELRARQPQQ